MKLATRTFVCTFPNEADGAVMTWAHVLVHGESL